MTATNLQIGTYGASRFEVQGDVMGPNGFLRTVKLAVFDTLAAAQLYVARWAA